MKAPQEEAPIFSLLICLAACLLFFSCRSSKNLAEGSAGKEDIAADWFGQINATSLRTGTVSGKIKLELAAGGKKQSVGGSCTLQRDKIIRLSLVAFGFVEVGRVEITPDCLMIVNRMQKEYAKVRFADVPYLTDAGISFHNLQALFWAELFVADNDTICTKDDFLITRNGSQIKLESAGFPAFTTQFTVNLATSLINRAAVLVPKKKSTPLLEWNYEHYAEIEKKAEKKHFPDQMRLVIMGGGNNPTADLSLSNLKWSDKEIEPSQEPGKKYKQIDADALLKALIK